MTGLLDAPAAPAARQSAVAQTMSRQVRNAALAAAGDPALHILRQRLAVAPGDVSIRTEIATWYERAGQPELALEHTRLARAKAPDSVELLLREVRLLEALDLPSEAVSALEAWIAAHPAAPAGAHSRLGILLDNSGDLAQGEKSHRAALALAAADDRLHNNLGWNLLLQRRHAEAAGEFQAALRFNSRSETARNNLRLARALDAAARGHNPAAAWGEDDSAALHNNLAAVWIENGRYTEARRELALAIAARRGYLPALRNLQLVAELDGRPASVDLPSQPGRWNRFTSALRRAILGATDVNTRNQPAGSAPRSASR
jgi:Flp pilus assembly protein TadD